MEHRVAAADVATYGRVDMAAAVSQLPAGTDVLSVYGLVHADNLADGVGYTGHVPTCDGVVPLADVPEVGNSMAGSGNLHTLALLPNCSHYYREPGSKERLAATIVRWMAAKMPPPAPNSRPGVQAKL